MLLDGVPAVRIHCLPGLIPAPGQYLSAYQPGSTSPLAEILFRASLERDGFLAAPPVPSEWRPGIHLDLRGPLGHGFALPANARRVALIAVDDSPRRLLALVEPALKQDASITLVCDRPPDDLPLRIEAQPLSVLGDVVDWADYAAFDASRESLVGLGRIVLRAAGGRGLPQAQVLVRVVMPCGALADCGVCSVKLNDGIALACDAGPVFDLKLLDLESQ